jgi:hypothetical protein
MSTEPIPVPLFDKPAHRPTLPDEKVRVEVFTGASRHMTVLVVNSRLVSGVLPAGGGRRLHSYEVRKSWLLEAIGEAP